MRLTSLVHFCRWWRVEQSTMLSVTDCSVPQRENKSSFVVAQIGRVFSTIYLLLGSTSLGSSSASQATLVARVRTALGVHKVSSHYCHCNIGLVSAYM